MNHYPVHFVTFIISPASFHLAEQTLSFQTEIRDDTKPAHSKLEKIAPTNVHHRQKHINIFQRNEHFDIPRSHCMSTSLSVSGDSFVPIEMESPGVEEVKRKRNGMGEGAEEMSRSERGRPTLSPADE